MPTPAVETDFPFWRLSITALLERTAASPNGLSSGEAAARLAQFGPNVIHGERKRALALQFLAKFRNPLVIILLVASGLSVLTGDVTSFFIIGAIVLVSVTLDFVQEYRAGQAAERLRQSVAVRGRVLRDGKPTEIPLAELVPGDVALLAAGDLIPCDGRVLEAKDFFVNQALLTGEPYPVEKAPGESPTDTDILSAGNAVLLGTSVISGSARVLMCRTGQDTALGEIADTLLAKAPPTAFEQGTQHFGILIMHMTILLVLFVLLVNAFFHRPWLDSFLFAVALAVGLTPELLPMVVSVTLSRGAVRMAASKVIVKRLASIHNLGSMDVFCTDKTGTLTEARIHLERHLDPLGQESRRVLELAYFNSFFETGMKSPLDDAILEHQEIDASAWRKIDEVPFDFERRRISVLLDDGTQRLLVVKGAPEDILRLSVSYGLDGEAGHPLDDAVRMRINGQFEALGREGFRVLGIAWRQESTGALPFPVIVFHGDRDTTVHPCNGDQIISQCAQPAPARAAQASTDPQVTVQRGRVPKGHAYSCTIHHGPGGRPIAEHWLVHGAGHAWSGGSSHGSYTDPKGPDASQQMLRFFLEHPKGGLSA